MDQKTYKGITLAIIGGIFWGASGTVAEYLFNSKGIPSTWLVGLRLLVAGLLLLVFSKFSGQQIFSIWKKKESVVSLLLFSFLGMLPSQLAYFMAIKYGNAATATVLQFLGPIFILVYLSLVKREWPSKTNGVSICLAVFGTFFLVTSGSINSLSFSLAAIGWGVSAGLSQASYTLLPRNLLQSFSDTMVVGWGMLLSGLPFLFEIHNTRVQLTGIDTLGSIAFIILFGTMLAYLFYLKSLRYISPSITGMLSSFEPLTATGLSVLFLSASFNAVQLFGGALILSAVFVQSFFKEK